MTAKRTDHLDLRAAPRHRIVRFRRGVVILATALAACLLIGVAMIALNGSMPRRSPASPELYDTDKKPTADGLAALPGDYSQATPPPTLGPPLPGDLGRAIVAGQGGVEPDDRSEAQRLAQQAVQAREAGVFFRIATQLPPKASAATAQPAENSRLPPDPERSQNNSQDSSSRKRDFLNQRDTSGIDNPHALQTPASPCQLMAGGIIAASLITGINADLPGLVVAQVTENVYDTVSGQTLLIPQGARLIGTYDSVVAFGQSRALLVWQRIVMPNGSSLQIDNLPATDAAGYAGLEDKVDYHSWALLKGIALSTLLGVGTQLSLGANDSDLVRAIRESTQQNAAQAGQRITEKNLNIPPTITIRPGWPVRVIAHKDLTLNPSCGD